MGFLLNYSLLYIYKYTICFCLNYKLVYQLLVQLQSMLLFGLWLRQLIIIYNKDLEQSYIHCNTQR